MKNCFKIVLTSALLTALPFAAFAQQRPHTHDGEQRIMHFHYDERDVFHVDVNFRYITMIQFERGEVVNAIQIGDSESFQVSRLQRGDIVTVKPLIANARTNMNIITSKRTYTFFLNAVEDGAATGQNFRLAFKYGADAADTRNSFVESTSGTVATGRRSNTNYRLSGDSDFAPLDVYDDGVNTWVRYSPTARRPAVFQTNDIGEESVINYTAHPNHLIQLHGLSKNWTLRIGDEIVCIQRFGGVVSDDAVLSSGQPLDAMGGANAGKI